MTFLIQLIGLPLAVVLGTLSAILFTLALTLLLRFRNAQVLAAFQPLAWLPVVAGLVSSLTSMLSSIGLQLGEDDAMVGSSSLLLQMSLVPLLASFVASLPAVLVASFGRYLLVWNASGLRWFPAKPETNSNTSQELDSDAWVARETDDYLDKLVRPR
ncbi:hypothetical protein LOC71_05515 [Rhodopirellula sp. JC740]|uniref:MotA/TolQ/ExbB proton channel domain-containing protein n=1 Tax=Rhodopirellula halodulae TaxID=2894198 RepID=A0ABS8NE73_9BACT|nr:hypothetical protein [Rhodopirellula sp. JC740]MCC9641724.1 hypothetical protein [Rhodopirellula sp. JC740]